jgi:hypothetical protein
MGPSAAAADREGRGAIAADGHAADIFEQLLAAAHIVAKFVTRLAVGAEMIKPVARQLVSFSDDASSQVGVAFRHPTQDEESSSRRCLTENVEHALGIPLDPPRQRLPTASIDRRRKRLDLEIILDIDRQRVLRAAAWVPVPQPGKTTTGGLLD